MDKNKNLADSLVHLGRDPKISQGTVNLPIYQCSTMLFDTLEDFERAKNQRYEKGTAYYGRYGNPASFELENMIAKLENGAGCVSVSSGLTAVTVAIMATVSAGSHILVADNVYGPSRLFCDNVLSKFGVDVTYYDPMDTKRVAELIRPETSALLFEAPGSGTFEVPDIRGLCEIAKANGITSILDGTWSTPVFCQPLTLGVDILVHSGSKYIMGHSDGMIGFIVTQDEHYDAVRRMALAFGDRAGATDIFLALRGLRTLEMRMRHHESAGMAIATWLSRQPQVKRMLHPAFEDCPGHEFWQRDFSGASGLFSVVLHPIHEDKVRHLINNLKHFSIGLSWGGFESLVLPINPTSMRTATSWSEDGPILRFSIGNESSDTLINDLEQGFKSLM